MLLLLLLLSTRILFIIFIYTLSILELINNHYTPTIRTVPKKRSPILVLIVTNAIALGDQWELTDPNIPNIVG